MKISCSLFACLISGIEQIRESYAAEVKITAGDATAYDNFGVSVSISGDTAIVGAPHGDSVGDWSGAAYIFVRDGTGWVQQAKLTPSDASEGDGFGVSVAISGEVAVVGAWKNNDVGDASGAVYIFVREGTGWLQQARLVPSDASEGNGFGVSVAIDRDTAIVGAWRDDDAGDASGAVYIFVRSGAAWKQQAKLTANDVTPYDNFGISTAISEDTAIIGTFIVDSAYIFARDGTRWTQQARLAPGDDAVGNGFGESVSVSGNTAIVGAPYDDDGGGNSGAAYIFVCDGTDWTQQAKFIPSDVAVGDWFASAVSISGNTAIVGAWRDNDAGDASGSAYIFVRSGTHWTQGAKFTASDAAMNDIFGQSVSISGDFAIVGAYADDHAGGDDSGSAYIYHAR